MDWQTKYFILSVFLLSFNFASSTFEWQRYGREALESNDLNVVLQSLKPKSLFDNHRLIHRIYGKNETVAANDTCTRDIAVLNGALISKKSWALQMLDASSKLPSGVLQGNIIDLGMYDECIAAEGQYLGIEIKGRHCMYSVGVKDGNGSLPLDPSLSICVPRSCSAQDVKSLINSTIGLIDKLKKIDVTIDAVTCATVDKVIWDAELTIWSLVLGVLLGFLLVCSACEAHVERRPAGAYRSPLLDCLGRFSVRKSAAAILATRKPEGQLPSLDGLRVLSMAWVVLGHEYVNQMPNVPVNGLDALPWIQSWGALYVLNGLYAVDTFFTLSGFLMTYMFIKHTTEYKRFNVASYYAHRILRLTPAVIGLLIICIVFVPKIGSGARWDFYMDQYLASCRDKLWPTLLYMQNNVNTDNLCLGHLWYLAVDMQLFLISPLILYPMYKKPKIGLIIVTILLVISIAIPAYIIGTNHYRMISAYQTLNQTEVLFLFQEVYEKTYNRASPWLIGIYLGFEVASNNRELSKKTICCGWITTCLAFAFCLLGTKIFTDPNYVYNPTWETFFYVAGKPIWACAICWICYASIYNCAGPISRILSCDILLPFSRLSYCIYLVHFIVQVVRVAATRTPSYFSNLSVLHVFLGDLMITIVVSFLFCLTFESPFVALEKVFIKKRGSTSQKRFNRLDERSDEEEIISRED